MSGYIPKDERIITIEDSAELRIEGVPNLVRLEARNANVEGSGEITLRELLKSSLRMRPSRIIVGEVRGSEAIDMLQSLNTGHCGASSGHSNSPRDMLSRLETMVLMGMDIPLPAIQRQIASSLQRHCFIHGCLSMPYQINLHLLFLRMFRIIQKEPAFCRLFDFISFFPAQPGNMTAGSG